MFKVECPGCQAPYQVDERRVPAKGLGMRCPKCGTSFTVNRPDDASFVQQAPASGPGQPVGPGLSGGGTVTGVAPARKPSAPKMGVPGSIAASGAPRPPGAPSDLPAVPAGGVSGLPLPRPGAPQAPRMQQIPAQGPKLDFDLSPSPRPDEVVGLPATTGPRAATNAPQVNRQNLGPSEVSQASEMMFNELDFHDPKGLSVAPNQSRTNLPVRPGGVSQSNLPMTGGNLPAPTAGGFSSPNLPALDTGLPLAADAAGGLPLAADIAGGLPAAASSLPQPQGDALPVPMSEFAAAPAALGDFALPDPAAGSSIPARTISDPFAFDGDDPFAGAVPNADVFGSKSDPFLAAAAQAGSISPSGEGAARDPLAPAGTVVYPNASAHPPTQQDPFSAAPGGGDLFGGGSSAFDTGHSQAPGFGDEVDPFAAPARAGDPFGGGGTASSARSAFDTAAGAGQDHAAAAVDPFAGAEQSAFDTAAGIGSLVSVPPPAAPAGGSFAPPAPAMSVAPAAKASGGTDYGEVDLGGGDSDFGASPVADDGMEFGGVPQEEVAAQASAAIQANISNSPLHARMAIGAMPEIETDRQRRRRKRQRNLIGIIFGVIVAGSSLALSPKIGPFGFYYVSDRVKLPSYRRTLADTQRRMQELRATDVFSQADNMVDEAVRVSERSPRFKPFAAYAVYVRYWTSMRFGPLPDVESIANVAIDELLKDGTPIDKLKLAQAAESIVDGNLAKAREFLDGLSGSDNDPDVLSLRGELELRSRNYEKAEQVWTTFMNVAPSAQSTYGLARAVFARNDDKRALELANKTIELSPNHLDARILIARLAWEQNDEAKATEALNFVVSKGKEASPGVLEATQTWLGNIHLSRGRISQAEKAYSEALKMNGRSGDALRGLGDTLYAAGRYLEALQRFESALEVDPDSLLAAVGIGKSKLALERLDEAKGDLLKLYQTYPKDMNVAYWYGQAEDALGNKDAARPAYQRAIEVGGKKAECVKAYIALASLQSQLGDVDGADATLATALRELPESPELHKALGNLALDHGRFDPALAEYQKALDMDPHDVEARFAMGTTKRRMRLFDEALEIFNGVATIDPNYPGFALERGLLFEEWGRIDDALKEYEAALAKAPNDPDVMLRVGCARVAAGHADGAEEILRKVQTMRVQPGEAAHCLGRALLLKSDLGEAMRLLQRAVDISPKRAEYHLYLGWAANEAGRLVEADAEIRKALDLDQGLADAYWQRGVLKHKQTALDNAVDDLNYALKLSPSRVEAHAELAGVYTDMGQEQRALAEWALATTQRPDNMLWHFRYGKLLSDNQRPTDAETQLLTSIELAKKESTPPHWLWEAHLYTGRVMGMNPKAVEHWLTFLSQAPASSPYVGEAKEALKRLGHPVKD
ncbi:MAG TPA: tetratricopeptide repeat protein [Polyangiaceae bacterium]|nr:tetratricopeptide repeat protein [Polyangiaceae bacterium]